MKKVFSFIMILVLALAVAGCGGKQEKTKYATAIAVQSKGSRVQINGSITFTYKLTPADGVVEGVTWSVSDPTLGSITEREKGNPPH